MKFTLLAIFGVLLAGLGLLFLRTTTERQPDSVVSVEGDSGPVAQDVSPVVADAGSRSAPVATESSVVAPSGQGSAAGAAAPKLAVLLIQGLDGDTGEPLAGAAFTYRTGRESASGTLSDAGEARVEIDSNGWLSGLCLSRTDAYASSNTESLSLKRGTEQRIVLRSVPGGTLQGTVVNESGQPVGGAEVRVWTTVSPSGEPDASVVSLGDGSFTVPRVGPNFVAAARTDSMACVRGLRGKLDLTTRCEGLELVVGPTAILEGTVVDGAGLPIAGARLMLSTGLNSSGSHQNTSVPGITWFGRLGGAELSTQTTEADGWFRFERQAAGQLQVRVEAEGFVGRWTQLKTGDSPVTVPLGRGLTMRGKVFLPDGAPAVGARVRFAPKPRNTSGPVGDVMETGPTGEFVLSGLNPEERGSAYMTVSLAGYAVEGLDPPVIDSGLGESNDIRLERAQPLSGVVRHPSGEPAAGIRVVLDGGGRFGAHNPFASQIRSWESVAGVEETHTDGEGRFAFLHRRQGEVALRVWPTDDRQVWINVDVAATEEVIDVTLDPMLLRKVAFQWRAVDAASGEPLPELTLVVWRDTSGFNHTVSANDGVFELIGLEPGEIKLEARADGFASQTLIEDTFELGEHDLGTIRMVGAVDVAVLVVDENGEPWRSGGIGVLDSDGGRIQFQSSPRTRTSQGRLNGEPVSMGGLPAEALTLRVEAEGVMQDVPFDPRLVLPGEVARITLEVPDAAPQRTVAIALLRRSALDSPDEFTAAMEKAIQAEDASWFSSHLKDLTAAGPRSEVVLRATSADGLPARATVKWNDASQMYSVDTSAVSSSSPGSLSSTSSSEQIPIPVVPLEPRMRGNLLDLELKRGETVLLKRSIQVSESQEMQLFVLLY